MPITVGVRLHVLSDLGWCQADQSTITTTATSTVAAEGADTC